MSSQRAKNLWWKYDGNLENVSMRSSWLHIQPALRMAFQFHLPIFTKRQCWWEQATPRIAVEGMPARQQHENQTATGPNIQQWRWTLTPHGRAMKTQDVCCWIFSIGDPIWSYCVVIESQQKSKRNMGLSENRVYSQWNSHLIGMIVISKTIGFRGTQHFQTHPYDNKSKNRKAPPRLQSGVIFISAFSKAGGAAGRPAKPRSASTNCGAILASVCADNSKLVSRRSPWTRLCGPGSSVWELR